MSNVVSFFFYLPLALLGLPPAMFLVHKNLNLLYQFWIHTEVVGSIGPLEMVLNTPSHHRVHHRPGTNANYAGVLIIWDRLFGTFISEGGAQVDNYGLGEPTLSFDPLWMQFVTAHRTLTRLGLRALLFRRRIRHRFVVRPAALVAPLPKGGPLWKLPTAPVRPKYAGARLGAAARAYVLVHTVLLVALHSWYNKFSSRGAGPPSPPPSSSSPPTTSDASPTATAAPSPSRARAPSRSASRCSSARPPPPPPRRRYSGSRSARPAASSAAAARRARA